MERKKTQVEKTSAFYSKDFFLISFYIFLSRKVEGKNEKKKKGEKLYLARRVEGKKENFSRVTYTFLPTTTGSLMYVFFFFQTFFAFFL